MGRGGRADEGGGLFRSEWRVLKEGCLGGWDILGFRFGGGGLVHCAPPPTPIFCVRHCTARTAVLVHCCVRGSRASSGLHASVLVKMSGTHAHTVHSLQQSHRF